ncbi:MAG: hypothetical protein RLZZ165_131 [Bacteroidota bacterium]|jgi:two-component SAPR family response regulator
MEILPRKKLRCLLIDSDVSELRGVARIIVNHPDLELVNSCRTGRSAVNLLKKTMVDFIMINPALPDTNGFDLVASLPNPPVVVIISDRQDYAYYAFRIQALDYRLKPITPEILRLVVARVHTHLQMKQALLKMQASENMVALAETLK